MDLSGYSAETVKAVKAAMAAAESVLADENADQTEVDAAVAALNASVDNLKKDDKIASNDSGRIGFIYFILNRIVILKHFSCSSQCFLKRFFRRLCIYLYTGIQSSFGSSIDSSRSCIGGQGCFAVIWLLS